MDNLTREDLQARLEQYKAEKDLGDHHINIEPDDLIAIIETALSLTGEVDGFEALLQRKDAAIDNLSRDAQDWKGACREKTAQYEALRAAANDIVETYAWRHNGPTGPFERVLVELLDGKP